MPQEVHMLLAMGQFAVSGLVIVMAGIFLTHFADQIAEVTGWGRIFIGGLLLAGATSLPELLVDLHAVRMNLPDLAVGDLLGSSLFNLLILAILDFSFPSAFRRTAFSHENLHHSLSAMLGLLLTAVVGLGIMAPLDLSFFGVGIFAWAVLVFYVIGIRLTFSNGESTFEAKRPGLRFRGPLLRAGAGYLVCTLVIVAAAPYLVDAADQLARLSGLGHSFLGTTLVALSTSLPELVATLVAFRMGAPDLALGNIFGSNAFNMMMFVPLDFFFGGNLFSSVRPIHAVTAFAVVTATAIAVMGQLYRKKPRSRFSEPSSEVVVGVILLLLLLLYWITKE